MLNHYQRLGLRSGGVTDREVYRAYRALAKRYHPDSGHPQASKEKFQMVKQSYEVLKTAADRNRYEAQLTALREIERFEKLARESRGMNRLVANGSIRSRHRVSERKGIATVLPFRTPSTHSVRKGLYRRILAGLCEAIVAIKEEFDAALARRDDEQLRILTRKLNRIPESEIGAEEEVVHGSSDKTRLTCVRINS